MKGLSCTICNVDCFENQYPEIVFKDSNSVICELCSIDFEETDRGILLRNQS